MQAQVKKGLHTPASLVPNWPRLMGCASQQVLPFSTGVIMEPLPLEKIVGFACGGSKPQGRQLVCSLSGNHDNRYRT